MAVKSTESILSDSIQNYLDKKYSEKSVFSEEGEEEEAVEQIIFQQVKCDSENLAWLPLKTVPNSPSGTPPPPPGKITIPKASVTRVFKRKQLVRGKTSRLMR